MSYTFDKDTTVMAVDSMLATLDASTEMTPGWPEMDSAAALSLTAQALRGYCLLMRKHNISLLAAFKSAVEKAEADRSVSLSGAQQEAQTSTRP